MPAIAASGGQACALPWRRARYLGSGWSSAYRSVFSGWCARGVGRMSNKMWGGRFASGPDAIMEEINASIDFDKTLWRQDIRGSLRPCSPCWRSRASSSRTDAGRPSRRV